ncbi:hypothetical protein QYF36_001359 [Acer negundo]|nr:hypothetical protein QYF36_001359 [Acer negundo]
MTAPLMTQNVEDYFMISTNGVPHKVGQRLRHFLGVPLLKALLDHLNELEAAFVKANSNVVLGTQSDLKKIGHMGPKASFANGGENTEFYGCDSVLSGQEIE